MRNNVFGNQILTVLVMFGALRKWSTDADLLVSGWVSERSVFLRTVCVWSHILVVWQNRIMEKSIREECILLFLKSIFGELSS